MTTIHQCAAAHPEDTRACVGARDGVTLTDQTGQATTGCVLHTAVALRSLRGARVGAGTQPGAATAAYRLAGELTPYAWHGDLDRDRADALYRWHVRHDDAGRVLCPHDDYDGQGCHWRAPDEACVAADHETSGL